MDALFRYTFQAANGDYYSVSNTGAVTLGSQKVYLTEDPDGWESMQVSFARSEDRGGVFRKSTVALKFHGNAAKITRHVNYNSGVAGYCKVTVEKQNRDFTSNNWDYVLWYACEVNFANPEDGNVDQTPGDVFFQTRLTELGLPALLEANGDKMFEIPLFSSWTSPTVNTPAPYALLGRLRNNTIRGQYHWLTSSTSFFIPKPPTGAQCIMPLTFLERKSIFQLGEAKSVDNLQYANPSGLFFETTYDFLGTIKSTFSLTYTNPITASVAVKLRVILREVNSQNQIVASTTLFTDPTGVPVNSTSATKTITINHTQTFAKYRNFAIMFQVLDAATGFQVAQDVIVNISQSFDFTLYAEFVMPESTYYGVRYIDIAKELIKKWGYTLGSVISTSLNNQLSGAYVFNMKLWNCLVTSGASLRNLDNPVIKTCWNDLEDDLRCMSGSGVGVEGNNLRIEPLKYFFNKSLQIAAITNNSPVKKSPALPFIYNKISIGFDDSRVDEINGLDEFCCKHEYSANIIAHDVASKELDLKSPYIHGMYSIESIRSYLFLTDDYGTPEDNEVCVIEVQDTMTNVANVSAYEVRRGIFGGGAVSGITYPADAYNLGHTPKNCLMRNMDRIKSMFPDGHVISFQSATKNKNILHGQIVEAAWIEITALGVKSLPALHIVPVYPNAIIFTGIDRIFLPHICETKAQMPDNLLVLLETLSGGVPLKNGYIRINDRGYDLDLFILDCGVTPGTDDAYLIRGLMTTNNNLQNMIH